MIELAYCASVMGTRKIFGWLTALADTLLENLFLELMARTLGSQGCVAGAELESLNANLNAGLDDGARV